MPMKTLELCEVTVGNPDLIQTVKQDLQQLPMGEVTQMLKAISEVNRTKIVTALARHGELCVCDIAGILDLSQANASGHLRKLYKAGIIKDRRQGKQVYYSLDDDHVQQIIDMSIAHKEESL